MYYEANLLMKLLYRILKINTYICTYIYDTHIYAALLFSLVLVLLTNIAEIPFDIFVFKEGIM